MPAENGGLAGRWPLDDLPALRDELWAAYAAEGRSYHDTRHLTEVLDRLDELGCHDVEVRLAAWFHDAVYDAAAGDEERSAVWAERALPPELAREVARLVRVTAAHDPGADDLAGQQLCDADLAILAAPAGRYEEYAHDVRREYAAVPDGDFARGREAILSDLLDRPRLFHSERARALWEEPARANLAAELERLRG